MSNSGRKSKWEEYLDKLGDTRPWDLIDPTVKHASPEDAEARYDICKSCPELINLTKQCKQCGCFMAQKTKLAAAECPLHKW